MLIEPEQIGPPAMQKNPFTPSTLTSDSPAGQFEPGATGANEAAAPPVDDEGVAVADEGAELAPCGAAGVGTTAAVPPTATLHP